MHKEQLSKAPMKGDSYNRFKKYAGTTKKPIFNFFFNWLIKGILVGIIISIDFILFASSSNYSLFAEGLSVVPHILIPIIAIFAISILFMFLISFSYMLENIFVSFIFTISTFAIINQFITISPDSFLYSISYNIFPKSFAGLFVKNSDVIVSLGIGIISLLLLMTLNNKWIFFIFSLFFMIFVGIIADEYINQKSKTEFVTLYEDDSKYSDVKGNNFIYIMLPNATSYRYLSNMQEDNLASKELKEVQDIMLGFYAQNNFKLYNGAYVDEENMFVNISNQFNILSGKKSENNMLDNIMIDSYMKFKNRNEKHVYLEKNSLFDTFKNANYKINVYQSHGIELCLSNNELVANKCVEKQNRPFNFQSMNISEIEKTKFLILQWIDSTALFKNLAFMHRFIDIFTNADKVALVGIPYNNLNVVNSIKTLDVIIDDMIKGGGNSTYFTILDVPGDMYIYDEFCDIKKNSEWLSKDNLPWVKVSNTAIKKNSYAHQLKCTYGKLQEFIDKLDTLNLTENTTIVIQGVSGYQNIKTEDFILQFRADKTVTLAIKDPKYKRFSVVENICPAGLFLTEYLYNKKICNTINPLNVSDALKKVMNEDINLHKIDNEKTSSSLKFYNSWYEKWAKANNHIYEHSEYSKLLQMEKDREEFEKAEKIRKEKERIEFENKEAKELHIDDKYNEIYEEKLDDIHIDENSEELFDDNSEETLDNNIDMNEESEEFQVITSPENAPDIYIAEEDIDDTINYNKETNVINKIPLSLEELEQIKNQNVEIDQSNPEIYEENNDDDEFLSISLDDLN